MSKPPRTASELYEVLIRLQQACFDAGSVEAAYHTLAAALHAAEDAGTTEGVEAVMAIGEQRQQALNSAEPAQEMSSGEASKAADQAAVQHPGADWQIHPGTDAR